MTDKVLIFLLFFNFCLGIFINNLPYHCQFFVWNFFILAEIFLLSLCLGKLVSYKNQKTKALATCLLIFSGFWLVSFVGEWIFSHTSYYNQTVIFFSIILFCLIFPAVAIISSRCAMPKNSKFDKKDSYLVYKKPRNWSGLIGLALQPPYGHCSLVTKNKIFKFKKGEVIEEEYFFSTEDLHIKILPVKLKEARKLLGTQWSLNNNCFRVFRKFRN